MSDDRRPQPSPGVMGYVARIQQFDTAAPWSPAPAAPLPEPADEYPPADEYEPVEYGPPPPPVYGVASVPPTVVDVVPPEIYQMVPPARTESPAPPPAFVARIPTSLPVKKPRPRRRRLQLALATAVALCGLAAVVVGYAAFTRTGASTEALLPALPGAPSDDDGFPPGGVAPGADPSATLPASAGASAAASTAPSASVAPDPSAAADSANPPVAGDGSLPTQSSVPAPAATEVPEGVRPAPPSPAPRPGVLTASFSHDANEGDDGITGYVGTIVLDNSTEFVISGWQVTLTVPGGNLVTARGPVDVTQRGDSVVFTSSGDAGSVPAGDSVSFTFTVRGVLAGLPGGCLVNGRSCS